MCRKNVRGVTNKKLLYAFSILLSMVMVAGVVSASGVMTDRLNFDEQTQHTVIITNTLGGTADSSSVMPTGFSFVSSTFGCTNPSGQIVTCDNIPDDSSAEFIITSTSSGVKYELYTLTTTLNGSALNNVSFLNIPDQEIFHTLVEYGRGRGNYFYNSMGSSTSAGTGTGYNFVPYDTEFELNYLHKVFNIKQYYSLPNSEARDVTFTCVYPYHTVVRQHLVESIARTSNDWTISYRIPRIEGSWERMGFLGMDIRPGEYNVGDNFTVSCTSLQYLLPDAYGYIVVEEDTFDFEIRDPDALSVVVLSSPATIGNGTSEVLVSYLITNDEVYPLDNPMIEIQAPENALFVGVRGELWGTALNRYVKELPSLLPGETVTVTLLARFDTSMSSATEMDLSQGVRTRFVPTWELNAYNPLTYTQNIPVTDTISVNYAVPSNIINIQSQLQNIEANTITINTTVNSIHTLVTEINSTTHLISSNLLLINTTLMDRINVSENNILDLVNAVNVTLYNQATDNFNNITWQITSLSSQVTNFQNDVEQLMNCTANPGSPICVRLDNLNLTLTNIYSDLLSINTTLSTQLDEVNSSIITEMLTQFGYVESNFTYTNNLITLINNSINSNIDAVNTSLSNDLSVINSMVSDVHTDLLLLNTSLYDINTTLTSQIISTGDYVIANLSAIFNSIINDSVMIMEELSYMQGFNEELIFLVTDSVGLAQASKNDFLNGNYNDAQEKLLLAGDNLNIVQKELDKTKKPIENEYNLRTATSPISKIKFWFKGLFL